MCMCLCVLCVVCRWQCSHCVHSAFSQLSMSWKSKSDKNLFVHRTSFPSYLIIAVMIAFHERAIRQIYRERENLHVWKYLSQRTTRKHTERERETAYFESNHWIKIITVFCQTMSLKNCLFQSYIYRFH